MPTFPTKTRVICPFVILLAAVGAAASVQAQAAGDGLLDPAALHASAGAKRDARPPAAELGGGESPEIGRAMAGSVVAALERLTRDVADLVHELAKLDLEIYDANRKLIDLQVNRTETLSEYRNGLFCSGCNKTRSEILAAGQTFPHEGQKAVEATPEMIANKEKALQGPIDELSRELQVLQDKKEVVQARRDEALAQIPAGYQLWITGVSCQHVLIAAADRRSEERYRRDHGEAEARLAKLSVENIKPDDAARRAEHQREVAAWTAARGRASDQRAADQQQIKHDYYQANRAARNDCDLLNGYFGREGVRQVLTLVAVVRLLSPRTGFYPEGGLFRMGDFSPAHHDQVLPAVRGFIAHFDTMAPAEFRVLNNFIESGPPRLPAAPETGVVPTAQKALRSLIEALPADDEGKAKPKPASNPGGIRG